jgi:hypothetical protein
MLANIVFSNKYYSDFVIFPAVSLSLGNKICLLFVPATKATKKKRWRCVGRIIIEVWLDQNFVLSSHARRNVR